MQAQGRATSRSKRTRSPPQKKIAARTPTPPITSRRQTRSSQPTAASKDAVRQVVLRAKERYRISMHERPSPEEGRAQKKPRLILPESSEEEEDGEEEGHPPPAATLTILLMTLHIRKIPQRELTTTIMTAVTPKVHFCGLRCILYFQILSKNFLNAGRWSSLFFPFTIMSSM
ncbi:hypothetical protein RHMOL_Rhmol01G0211900 [Rhododendron molle]|uniref:Uncharacterized protein n=1 Tax=Rhododendron molle TaxID=49168 RepID=A0ACC0Q598_RHOML|nr:hypothetical protein RHMOL_Rhmol01G0211900 [Rhododendron molle]